MDNDLILSNFGLLLASVFFAYSTSVVQQTITLIDTGGSNRTIADWNNGTAVAFNQQAITGRGFQVGVGTGTTPAARTDSNLQNIAGSLTALSGNAAWTPSTGQVTLAGSVLLAAGGTITEAGLFLICDDSGATARTIMCLHDVFTGVVISVGNFATVAYTLQC